MARAFYLLREYQRQGLGRRLIGHMARQFVGRGILSMVLFADAQNPSCRFYEAMGEERLLDEAGNFHGAYGWIELRIEHIHLTGRRHLDSPAFASFVCTVCSMMARWKFMTMARQGPSGRLSESDEFAPTNPRLLDCVRQHLANACRFGRNSVHLTYLKASRAAELAPPSCSESIVCPSAARRKSLLLSHF
jgi:hypothetical protein